MASDGTDSLRELSLVWRQPSLLQVALDNVRLFAHQSLSVYVMDACLGENASETYSAFEGVMSPQSPTSRREVADRSAKLQQLIDAVCSAKRVAFADQPSLRV